MSKKSVLKTLELGGMFLVFFLCGWNPRVKAEGKRGGWVKGEVKAMG